MPDLFKNPFKKVEVKSKDPQEGLTIDQLFRYTDPSYNPWQLDYLRFTLVDCYNFTELRQWESSDMVKLASADVPTLSADRTVRILDTVKGIRFNTGNKKKIVPREMGDTGVARVLDAGVDQVSYQGDFDQVSDDSFDNMLKTGIGIRKVGWDPVADGGAGAIFAENVKIEDFGYSECQRRTLKDVSWTWQRQFMYWQDAINLAPERSAEIEGLKTTVSSTWEDEKRSKVEGTFFNTDYGIGITSPTKNYAHQDYVSVWEFWVKRRIPYQKIRYNEQMLGPDGLPVMILGAAPVEVPKVKAESMDYQLQDGEVQLAKTVEDQWWQYIVIAGKDKKGAVLVKQEKSDLPFCPYVGMMATRKKSGQPMGLVEQIIPHQKRYNIAWSQKTAWNNKSIKSPLIMEEGSIDPQNAIQQSSLGAILVVKKNTQHWPTVNQQPQVDLQAIEEMNAAQKDMDFTAAASEAPLVGGAQPGSSGLKLSMQQNAAITPLNKWVTADRESQLEFYRKVLHLAIQYLPPERWKRIVGDQMWAESMTIIDPQTGQPVGEKSFAPDTVQYDVTIEDQSTSDFQKQQNFNAVMAMHGSGVLFTDQGIINQAPVKNVDALLADNQQARNDLIKMLLQKVQMLETQLGFFQKVAQKATQQNQTKNAQRGKAQPQAGQNMMLGGMSPAAPGSGMMP